ncbi:exonuclease SbcC [Shewanella sairae]|uniref:Exonuclease SbcC n=1 Tax=Shewanella sairae TaxID=190310 RepID=A0ABQ4PRN2_9GAMM|nr:ATPase, T2SS/T4P/T4SS family [Shewanella sairae]MCL1132241.1 Flp pilus assembly complex ATPase component TadA [Shewanella sairae]GIU51286.1 exonuclease SbcC [Shewanella sairae]
MEQPLNIIIDATLKTWYFEERKVLALTTGEIITSDYNASNLNKIADYIQQSETLNNGQYLGQHLPIRLVDQTQIDIRFSDVVALQQHSELKEEVLSDIGARFKHLQQRAVDLGSSDIHIELYEHEVQFYARVDGRRITLAETMPEHNHGEQLFAYIFTSKATSKDDDYVASKPNNGQLEQLLLCPSDDGKTKQSRLTLWRASYIPIKGGGKVTLRWLNGQQYIPKLESLGWTTGHIAALRQFLNSPSGVCALAGKTGSGKTTAIASIISEIQKVRSVHTLEDPPEFNLGIPQTAVTVDKNTDTKSGFASYSKVLLRHDVEVELHGEIRDHPGAMEVTRKGETGQLIFTTIHTSSATGIAHTLTEQFKVPASVVSAPGLMGIWAYQTLVRTLCPHCKLNHEEALAAYDTHELGDEWLRANDAINTLIEPEYREDVMWRNPDGCEHCYEGEKGRTALLEMIVLDDEDRHFILNKDYLGWQVALETKGYKTVRDHALSKIKGGEIDLLTAAGKVNQLIPQSSTDIYATFGV